VTGREVDGNDLGSRSGIRAEIKDITPSDSDTTKLSD
jgi:hypothetical protein